MTPEMLMPAPPGSEVAALGGHPALKAAHGFSLHDVARFEAALSAAGGTPAAASPGALVPSPGATRIEATSAAQGEGLVGLLQQLGRINDAPTRLLAASDKMAANPDAGPGDMLMTMMQVQKFVFECQVTASVANRTSDGVQELFRQQS
jgi:hypothetical protein